MIRLNKFGFEIASTDLPGILEFTVIESRRDTPEICKLNFQDLLQAEYNEDEEVLVAGRVHLNVHGLIRYINKKFYSL